MKCTLSSGLLVLSLWPSVAPACAQAVVEAGIALRMDLDQMVERADLVLSGHVLSARGVQGSHGRIDTEYTLTVDRTYWGEDLGQRIVRMPGGVLPNGRGLMIPGMARLSPGEDVVLLLSEEGTDGVRVPMGLAQGKYRVVTTRDGMRLAVRAQEGLELLRPATGVVLPAEESDIVDFAELVARLETAVATKQARLRAAETRSK